MTCVSIFLWHLAARLGVEMKIVPCLDPRLHHLFRLHPDPRQEPRAVWPRQQPRRPTRPCVWETESQAAGQAAGQGLTPPPRTGREIGTAATAPELQCCRRSLLARLGIVDSCSCSASPGYLLLFISTSCFLILYHRNVKLKKCPSLHRLCRLR